MRALRLRTHDGVVLVTETGAVSAKIGSTRITVMVPARFAISFFGDVEDGKQLAEARVGVNGVRMDNGKVYVNGKGISYVGTIVAQDFIDLGDMSRVTF